MWSVVCTCTRGSDRLALVARAVLGGMLRSWALAMRPRRTRLVVCGVPYAVAVLASEVARRAISHSSVRTAGRVPMGAAVGPECRVRYL